ncbi:hypothetical protein EMN47_20190 [Prolixibacteraceae bacterium JC049]|nr:hypothetical protein [Prolixibacteraceae bacterium JC049]
MEKLQIYSDSVIEIALFPDTETVEIQRIGFRYIKPQNYSDKYDKKVRVTNIIGEETDWFILPEIFSQVIGKKLFEQYNAGLTGFDTQTIEKLKNWLIKFEIIDDAMTY